MRKVSTGESRKVPSESEKFFVTFCDHGWDLDSPYSFWSEITIHHRRRRNWSVQIGRKGYGIHFMERSTNNYDRIFGNGRYYYGFLPGRPNKKIARGHQEEMTEQTESECCFIKTTLRLTKARFQWLPFEKWNSNCANVHHIRQIERWICLIKLNPILTIAKPHWSSFARYYALCIC